MSPSTSVNKGACATTLLGFIVMSSRRLLALFLSQGYGVGALPLSLALSLSLAALTPSIMGHAPMQVRMHHVCLYIPVFLLHPRGEKSRRSGSGAPSRGSEHFSSYTVGLARA